MELIPAIDIIDGKCVRLSQGDYATSKSYGEPLDMALRFQDHGIRRLHLVDLDGAREKRIVNHRILEQIASRTSLVIDAGGGVRSSGDLHILFESGASMVTAGSVAVRQPDEVSDWLKQHGPERLILGADFKDGRIAISGWQEQSELELKDFISSWREEGFRMSICTDVSRDGMLQGPATDLYQELKAEDPGLYLIASGGVSSLQDLEALREAGLDGAILGKAIYEGKVSLPELERFILPYPEGQ